MFIFLNFFHGCKWPYVNNNSNNDDDDVYGENNNNSNNNNNILKSANTSVL